MNDAEAHEFYKDPEHLRPGPAVAKRVRPGVKAIRYEPASCGPQTATVNMGSQPYWQKLRRT